MGIRFRDSVHRLRCLSVPLELFCLCLLVRLLIVGLTARSGGRDLFRPQ